MSRKGFTMNNNTTTACELNKTGSCDGCFYTEVCKVYNCTGDTVPLISNGFIIGQYPTHKVISVAVCEGRHEIPQATDGSIFGQTISEMKPAKLFAGAKTTLVEKYDIGKDDIVNLYVTGLTMATLAIINACKFIGAQVVCYHYDRETGEYIRQLMY